MRTTKAFTPPPEIPRTLTCTNPKNTIEVSTNTEATVARTRTSIQGTHSVYTSERISISTGTDTATTGKGTSSTITSTTRSSTNEDKEASSGRKTRNYIFGYGSLICSQSRKISAPTLQENNAIPVVIENIKRTWTARVGGSRTKQSPHTNNTTNDANANTNPNLSLFQGQTVMGIQQSHGHNCTGVLIEVDSVELANFDERERNYDRIAVDLKHVFRLPHEKGSEEEDHIVIRKAHQKRRTMFDSKDTLNNNPQHDRDDDNSNVDAKVWVYLPRNGGDGANHYYPIMQSYVDIILRGCMNIGQEFTESFLASTHGWWHDHSIHHPESEPPAYLWVDDRHEPHYIRADEKWSKEMKHIIDDLIRKVIPEPFEKRRHLDTLN